MDSVRAGGGAAFKHHATQEGLKTDDMVRPLELHSQSLFTWHNSYTKKYKTTTPPPCTDKTRPHVTIF